MAPSAPPSFSLDNVQARIAELRAQLRADADVGGSCGVVNVDASNTPSSSRFAALVELGSLLATCSLPEYSAPPAPFPGAYVPRSQDEEAALCLLLAADDEAFSSSSASSAAPAAWPLALSLADDPARLASALARRPPPPAAAARLWCVRGEALLAAGKPEAARAAFRAATAAAEATKEEAAVGSKTATTSASSSFSSSEALLPMLLSVRAALAARDPAGALAAARSAAKLVSSSSTTATATTTTKTITTKTESPSSSSPFPPPPPHAPTALALSSALWAAAHSSGGSAVLPCEARGGALAEALANAEAAAAADPACPRAAYQLALCLAEGRGDLEAAAESKMPPSSASLPRAALDLAAARLLVTAGAPFRRVLLASLLAGRSARSLAAALAEALLSSLGYLAAPASSPYLRSRPGARVVLRRWHALLVAAVAARYGIRGINAVAERLACGGGAEGAERRRALRCELEEAATYEEWSLAATKLDGLLDSRGPRAAAAAWAAETRLYDRRLLEQRLGHLRDVRARSSVAGFAPGGDAIREMMFALRTDLLRNLGNMAVAAAAHETFRVAPEPIRAYIDEVKLHLNAVADAAAAGTLPLDEVLNFLRETRHAFGRTALVLSGGGALGAFHVGVVKALLDARLLPRVLAGSSAGAIVAAAVATRNDAELEDMFAHAAGFDLSFFANSTASQFVRHLLLKGTLQDGEVLSKRLRRLLGDATFLQAFQHSGRILNVSVSAADTNEPPRVLNYLTAPHVVVWSAVACSSAFPLLFLPQDLLCRDAKGALVPYAAEGGSSGSSSSGTAAAPGSSGGRRWRDGSLEEDLPMQSLSEMFNVNHFLVSQTNPHIVPLLNLKAKAGKILGALAEAEWKHRCRQAMVLFPGLRWLKVLSQPWEGDVTMVLPPSLTRLIKSITNPSKADLDVAAREGERATWNKLSAISANCGIETTLDGCMLRLSGIAAARKAGAARAASRGARLRSRIPSWVSLTASGLPHVASDDSLAEGMGGGGGRAGENGGAECYEHNVAVAAPSAAVAAALGEQFSSASSALFAPAPASASASSNGPATPPHHQSHLDGGLGVVVPSGLALDVVAEESSPSSQDRTPRASFEQPPRKALTVALAALSPSPSPSPSRSGDGGARSTKGGRGSATGLAVVVSPAAAEVGAGVVCDGRNGASLSPQPQPGSSSSQLQQQQQQPSSPSSPLSPTASSSAGRGRGGAAAANGDESPSSSRASFSSTCSSNNDHHPHEKHRSHSHGSFGDVGAPASAAVPAPPAPAEVAFAAASALPFDCCDVSVSNDIWGSLMPPRAAGGTSSSLSANGMRVRSVGDGLDFMAM